MSRQQKLFAAFGGCATTMLLCGIIIYFMNPVQLAMSLAGFDSRADTDTFLNETATAQQTNPIDWSGLGGVNVVESGEGRADGNGTNSAPIGQSAVQVVPETITSVAQVTVNVQGQQGVIDTGVIHAERVEQAQTTSGTPAYYAEYNQAGANALATDLFTQYAPADVRQQVRNPRVELKQGAVIVYAEANLELGWQEVGLVMQLTNNGRQFEVAGIDINGQLYNTPPSGYISELMQTIELEGNRALNNAQIVTPSGNLNIQQIYITEDTLQLIAN